MATDPADPGAAVAPTKRPNPDAPPPGPPAGSPAAGWKAEDLGPQCTDEQGVLEAPAPDAALDLHLLRSAPRAAAAAATANCGTPGVPSGLNGVCRLTSNPWPGSSSQNCGSGFIAKRSSLRVMIVTAGHDLYKGGNWATGLKVWSHDGQWSVAVPQSAMRVSAGWQNGANRDHDYGAILLDGTLKPPLTYAALPIGKRAIDNKSGTLIGFPSGTTTPTQNGGPFANPVPGVGISYAINACLGHSGSPVYLTLGGTDPATAHIAVAIHTYLWTNGVNVGVQVTDAVCAELSAWFGATVCS